MTALLCLLFKLHVIRVYLAFLANSSDRSHCMLPLHAMGSIPIEFMHSGNNYTFAPPCGVSRENKFRKNALDMLLVIHYDNGFHLITKLFIIFGRFCFGRDFLTGAVLGISSP
jgi:hypothetical protein